MYETNDICDSRNADRKVEILDSSPEFSKRNRIRFCTVPYVVAIIISCILLILPFSNSSAEPTLNATVEYIATKLGKICTSDNVGRRDMQIIMRVGTFFNNYVEQLNQMSLKTLYYRSFLKDGVRETESTETIYTFSLEDLTTRVDSGTITQSTGAHFDGDGVSSTFVKLHCSSPNCMYSYRAMGEPGCLKGSYSSLYGPTINRCRPDTERKEERNSEMHFFCIYDSERIVKALEHAIRLSGGKDELF